MTDAALVQVGKAVAAGLTAGPTIDDDGVLVSISGLDPRIRQAISVERSPIPRFNLPSQTADVYQVCVSEAGEQITLIGRNTIEAEYHIDIGMCGRLSTLNSTSVDAALGVLQDVGDYFFCYGLGSVGEWVRNDVYAWPDRERLQQEMAFFALWTAVFKGTRKKP